MHGGVGFLGGTKSVILSILLYSVLTNGMLHYAVIVTDRSGGGNYHFCHLQ